MIPRARRLQTYLEHLGGLCLACRRAGDSNIRGATADSREVKRGWLFCAIPGFREDGADYVDEAVRAGAVAVAAERPLDLPAHVSSVLVGNAYAAASRLAEVAYDFPARSLRMLGITGTNGKTTCAYLLRDMLTRAGCRTGMIGTVSYSFGDTDITADRTTPTAFTFQSLLRRMLDAGMDSAVVEVSSHALHQRRVGTVPFAGALFTNLTGDHLDYHETFENYYRAKQALFAECLAANAPAVINADDTYGRRLVRDLTAAESSTRLITYGQSADADVRAGAVSLSFAESSFLLVRQGQCQRLRSPLIGEHNVSNIAGAGTLALESGVSAETVAEAVHSCRGAPGRLQPIPSETGFTAFVDYAHTDDALKNVLTALRGLQPNRILVVFGCGGDRDRTKRPRMGRIAAELADRTYVTSDNPRSEDAEAIIEEIRAGIPGNADHRCIVDRREAIRAALHDAVPGDFVLVAGKGHEAYQEIAGRTFAFDDVSEVREAIEAL